MKALVKTKEGKGHLELLDVDEPTPGPTQVKIKVEYAGICGTDIHIMDDEYPYTPPVVLGHEFSGTIVEAGQEVERFAVGDRVVAETNAKVCQFCSLCKAGRFCLCDERKALGQKYDGVFAQHFVIGQETLHRIPEDVDMVSAALTEPLSCVVHAINERSRVRAGDVVVVSGPGPMGLLTLEVCKSLGATVIVTGTGTDAERLVKARELGADAAVDVEAEDIGHFVNQQTDGEGADVVLECSGSEAAVNTGLDLLRKRGVFTQIGLFAHAIRADFNKICFKEIDFHGSLSKTNYSWRKTLSLLEKSKVNTKTLVSDTFSLADWEKGFERARNRKGLKILLKP